MYGDGGTGVQYFRLMHPTHIHPEQQVRPPRVREPGRVREVQVDNQHGEEREEQVEPQLAEADEGIVRRDDAVAVAVPEEGVLLEDCLVSKA